MCYFVDLELDLEVTFQGQKEKMLILSSGHLSFARKTSGNVRKTLSTTAATPNTECWGVHWLGDSLQWIFPKNIQTRTYTLARRRFRPKLRRLVAAEIAWHPHGPWHGRVRPDPSVDSYLDLDPKGHRFGSRSKKRQNFKCRFLGQFASYTCQISSMDTRQRPPSNCAIATTYLDPNEQGVGVKKWRVRNCRPIFVEPVAYSPYVMLS